MKVAAGIITWQDGDALDNAVASIRGAVDEVIIADGLIDGIEAIDASGQQRPWYSSRDRLLDLVTQDIAIAPGARLNLTGAQKEARLAQRLWRTQSEMRNYTLERARELRCDWLLAIDADEELVNGAELRRWLELWRWDAFPISFYISEQTCLSCPFKVLHIPSWRRFACQGNILESVSGELVQVMTQTVFRDPREANMPYLVHRNELRPEWRQAIRLSEHEVRLEPYPEGVRAWRDPVYAPAPGLPAGEAGGRLFYCPACGRRYGGFGACSEQHPETFLEEILLGGGVAA